MVYKPTYSWGAHPVLVGGLEHLDYFSILIGNNPN